VVKSKLLLQLVASHKDGQLGVGYGNDDDDDDFLLKHTVDQLNVIL
jgi:hypothetical protein